MSCEPDENMMYELPVDDASEGLCYWDPFLDKHVRKYCNFMKFLNDRNLLSFTLNPTESIGIALHRGPRRALRGYS